MYYYCQVAVLIHNKHSLHCSKMLYHLGINRGRVLIYEGIEYTLKIIFDYCSFKPICTFGVRQTFFTLWQRTIHSSNLFFTRVQKVDLKTDHELPFIESFVVVRRACREGRERRGMDARGRARNARETRKSEPFRR